MVKVNVFKKSVFGCSEFYEAPKQRVSAFLERAGSRLGACYELNVYN